MPIPRSWYHIEQSERTLRSDMVGRMTGTYLRPLSLSPPLACCKPNGPSRQCIWKSERVAGFWPLLGVGRGWPMPRRQSLT